MGTAVFYVSIEGEPTAVMPFAPATLNANTCTVFSLNSGHGAGDYYYLASLYDIHRTPSPVQVQKLERVLRAYPYGYILEEIKPPSTVQAYNVRANKIRKGDLE